MLGGHVFLVLISCIAKTKVNYLKSRLGLAALKSRLGIFTLMPRLGAPCLDSSSAGSRSNFLSPCGELAYNSSLVNAVWRQPSSRNGEGANNNKPTMVQQ